jgi:hypothetical protein
MKLAGGKSFTKAPEQIEEGFSRSYGSEILQCFFSFISREGFQFGAIQNFLLRGH